MRLTNLLRVIALVASTALAEDFGAYFDEISSDRDFQALTFDEDFDIEEITLRVPSKKK